MQSKCTQVYCVVFERTKDSIVLLCDKTGRPKSFETVEAADQAAGQTFLGKRLGYKIYEFRTGGLDEE